MTTIGPNPPLAVEDRCREMGLRLGFGPIVAQVFAMEVKPANS
jgi:hypothetical protein